MSVIVNGEKGGQNNCSKSMPSTPAKVITSPAIFLRDARTAMPLTIQPREVVHGDRRAWARAHDQFYTVPDVAAQCLKLIEQFMATDEHVMLEPSAGGGAFFGIMPEGSLGVDIDPQCDGVFTADLLEVKIEGRGKVLVVGNPPFGRQASMAKRFFNYLAQQPQVEAIAFVLPRSFRKDRVQRDLNPFFHNVFEWQLPANAFLFDGQPYNVPAVFMIWVRRSERRVISIVETTHPHFEFIKSEAARAIAKRLGGAARAFGIQRVGNAAGKVHYNFSMSDSSHLFVRANIGAVEAIMCSLQPAFHRISRNVAGNPSIAKSEIVALYKSFMKSARTA